MPETPSFREEYVSQIPAVRLLMAMGYTYLPPDEALRLRGGRRSAVVLDAILAPWLREHNAITLRSGSASGGRTIPFSDANLARALDLLHAEPTSVPGLLPASQRVYELLTLGTTLTQTIDGDTKSYSLAYIDWQHPERNVYHVTEEFAVERSRSDGPGSHETRRPDIVCFVNGIPLVVIECKRPDLVTTDGKPKAIAEAISQMLRNQRPDEIPLLFTYAQLLLAVSTNEAFYATTGAEPKFWSIWKESGLEEAALGSAGALGSAVVTSLSELEKQDLYNWRTWANHVRRAFDAQDAAGDRLPTVQDHTLYAMLRPARLLHLLYQFILFDDGAKKIARYQQYFAVDAALNRVAALNAQQQRTGVPPRSGGVIWHTTGSGKSLTMFMIAKALALHPSVRTPRVIIVTDRINLDRQIWTTFRHCGKRVEKAASGADLAAMIRRREDAVITTIIDKFDTVARQGVSDPDPNVFLLVDESHRSQYGTAHARMRQVFPNACMIGFTGTPLLKREKSTALKFGGFIHTYSMRQAVEDGTVAPLVYEGRMAELAVDQGGIDTWFDRVTRGLSDDQKLDLKRKFSRAEAVSQVEQRVRQIAYDICDHYSRHFQGQGYKAQLATVSKAMALRYKRCFDEFGQLTSDIVISAPDAREGYDSVDGPPPELAAFWKRMMDRYGSEEAYNREILASFHEADGVELLIVVDKLLVGFDEPRNTVLYIDKPLREHGLLQAIARVNRLFEGKDFGVIVDYRGVLGQLNEAMQTYDALEDGLAGFDPRDLEGAFEDISVQIAALPQRHAALWAIFAPVANKQDVEALQRFLAPEDVRQRFYDALTTYAKTLKVAMSAAVFHTTTPADQIATYQRDLRFFHELRTAVQFRYAEVVDYREYELRVAKLLDSHIRSDTVSEIVAQVNIFDADAFQAQLDKLGTPAARADAIASHLKRTLNETMDRDPAFYARFSRMIEETIEAYRQGRITEAEYYQRMQHAEETWRQGHDEGLPAKLHAYRDAGAYYGILQEPLAQYRTGGSDGPGNGHDELCADIAIELERIIARHKIRDWTTNPDVQQEIQMEMDDYLYEIRTRHALPLTDGDTTFILDSVLHVAKHRERG